MVARIVIVIGSEGREGRGIQSGMPRFQVSFLRIAVAYYNCIALKLVEKYI